MHCCTTANESSSADSTTDIISCRHNRSSDNAKNVSDYEEVSAAEDITDSANERRQYCG
jgi:hypothetical protein